MMPLSLLAALFLAFGLDPGTAPASLSRAEAWRTVGEAAAGIGLIALVAFVVGWFVSGRVVRQGGAGSGLRRAYAWGGRLVGLLTLGVYAALIHEADWPRFARLGLGLNGVPLLADLAILAPFLLAQVAGWWGLFAAERALRGSGRAGPGLGRHLVLKGRQTVGLLLPILLVVSLGQDSARRLVPGSAGASWAQPVGLAATGVLVMLLSPLFVRLAWPLHSLPPGPLRDRLERLARRVGFRCTDILVWDTGYTLVNAGVTGALPWYRYVLLSDALIEALDEREVAAVFGHEIGHIAHRHLLSFAAFFCGSLAVLALASWGARVYLIPGLARASVPITPLVLDVVEGGLLIAFLGGYFLGVFGPLSRRFERQADVFGCRAVSCGLADCPPHLDHDARSSGARPADVPLCSVGIRIFVAALAQVAALNGIAPAARSWRHGSIDRRIGFLESLEGRPEAERSFQRGVRRFRLAIGLALLAAVCAVFWTGAEKYLK